ncbi:stearic acid desaturase (SdeA) [Aspergillus bombycis]|uniref:Acyl-CoA desaturase n=1 Tax=Aspergillus bombycis TaxID=109264 RepID=A0A1F8ADR8_9EURO|nr:stearic acid desaturase (SdeA) [Aspergillus bombycis]OGM49817.1 stearic acid desaturase (SdeA) [Aspergillus bombycis]
MTLHRSGAGADQRTETFRINVCRVERTLTTYLPARGHLRYKEFDWVNIIILSGMHLLVCIGAFGTPLQLETAIWMCIYDFFIALSLTAGYHRLWSHKSYRARLPLRICLATLGAGAFQWSIKWWSYKHRAHHRYIDTDLDPYNARKGLFYSHIGWLFHKDEGKQTGKIDSTDLNEDPVVIWQQRIYVPLSILAGVVFPSLVASLWDDLPGGIVYASCLRIVFRWHMTFCTNSLAHYMGEQPFDDRHSPRNHLFTALLTLGEGYHNFHHEFPNDYRNGIQWYDYDPTKWSIWIWKQLGLASSLNQTQVNETEKSRVQQLQKHLDKKRATLIWGPTLDELPAIEWDTYVKEVKNGARLLVIEGVVHDVTEFMAVHPGGRAILAANIGKDATGLFLGKVYNHSNAANNLLSTMRVGVIIARNDGDDGDSHTSAVSTSFSR